MELSALSLVFIVTFANAWLFFFFNSHKPSLFYLLGFIILCGRHCSYFNCFFAVQGKKLLDIDFPEGPFGTKVSALHFATSTCCFS
jgi:hypothetical protein